MWGSEGKPKEPHGNQAPKRGEALAILDESNLAAEAAKRATYRVNHVGTKLNESELRAFEALAARRKQTQGELIRGLILAEIQAAQQQNINQAPQYIAQSWALATASVQYQATVTVNAYSGGSYVAGNTDSYLSTSVGTGQCVPFVQAASGAPRTALWAPGEQVGPNTPAGTAIASFSRDGLYHGISGTNHAAILQSVAPNGRSAVIRDQWMNRDGTPHNVSDRTIRNLGGGLGGGSNDLSAFRLIMQTAN